MQAILSKPGQMKGNMILMIHIKTNVLYNAEIKEVLQNMHLYFNYENTEL